MSPRSPKFFCLAAILFVSLFSAVLVAGMETVFAADAVSDDAGGVSQLIERDAEAASNEDSNTCLLPLIFKNYDPWLVAFDDFSDRNSGWLRADNEYARYSYRKGEYEILAKKPNSGGLTAQRWASNASEGYSVAVDARILSGNRISYGLILDVEQNGDFYHFMIFDQEYFALNKLSNGAWQVLWDWTKSPHINPGSASNRIQIDRKDTMLRVYINDHLVKSVSAPANDKVLYAGLNVSTYSDTSVPVSVRFDNFEVRRLDK